MDQMYTYRWKNNPRRAELFGRQCKILTRGGMGTVLVEFENGERVTTAGRALKRIEVPNPSPRGRSLIWDVYHQLPDGIRIQRLGRVMGTTSAVALRAAGKRWPKFEGNFSVRADRTVG